MKKTFFLFAMLAGCAAFAQATVTPLSVDYDNQQVTFGVEWTTAANNRVWVFVDFCSVAGVTPSTFAPATISPVSVAGGSYDGQNGRGFYVYGNSTTVTATLSNITGKFNWCAYVSDYPPNILDYIDGAYTLRGTPPFTLKDANGNTQIVTGTTITQSSLTITPITMTDETGYPGYFCKYVSMDLFMNASYPCQPRTSGAQNWEAWIKDSRDEELYRIVFMPDNKWWLAQNVKYAGAGSSITVSGCTKDKCGRWYSFVEPNASYFGGTSGVGKYIQGVCPNGWMLPHDDDWSLLVNSLDPDVTIAQSYLMADDSPCLHTNSYGWATPHMMHRKNHTDWGDSWYSNGPVKSTVGRLCCPRYYAYDDWRQTPWEDIGDERRVRCFHLL